MNATAQKLVDLMNRLSKNNILHNMETGQYMRVILRLMNKSDIESGLMWEELSPYDFHDIGKALLPEELTDYQTLFTNEERLLAMAHVDYGQEIFANIAAADPTAEAFCQAASDIAYYHHECYDGSGYPDGLVGDEIPFLARVCAVANSFTGFRSGYGILTQTTIKEGLEALAERAGTFFDPDIVHIFVKGTAEALVDDNVILSQILKKPIKHHHDDGKSVG